MPVVEKPQMACILDKRVARGPGKSNTLSIWSNGRTIQLKMSAGKARQRYKSMDRPCRSSWTGAHEIFQVREYDAGASPTSSEPAWKTTDSWTSASTNLESHLGSCCAILNEVIKMKHTCIM
jgi:hypothetical protein